MSERSREKEERERREREIEREKRVRKEIRHQLFNVFQCLDVFYTCFDSYFVQ